MGEDDGYDRNVTQRGGLANKTLQDGDYPWGADFWNSGAVDLSGLHTRRLTRRAGAELLHRGRPCQAVYVLTAGWTCSYHLLQNGGRQIVNLQLPGDILGLQGLFLGVPSLSFQAVTDVEVLEVPASDFMQALKRNNQTVASVYRAALRDEAIIVEHLANLGGGDATQSLAHFLLETGVRLSQLGLASETGYLCPLSQDEIADVLGLSSVHVNRVLRHFREEGLVTFRDGFVRIHDYQRLVTLASFDPVYLGRVRAFPDAVAGSD
ncbi:Crp/Fnr family transcriptional regulator [Agrobacterium albertimagni]|uniref:Crp/Fnr family transcriptional regulator n=1 Tax=Agrobacterium albertimagni TaxID=147266 RepID=UPI0009FED23E|nr:Crp/Fnr family transcriptional regulator [Agrobacterium albertimagni]